jgi:hypothetical protein
MKSKDTNKKLEFKKETIARLGEQQLINIYGGTGGNGPSVAYANQCTITQKTKGPNYTCNVLNCKKTN